MEKFCKTLGTIILVTGVIGSFVMANIYGKSLYHSYAIRDNNLTVMIFVCCFFSTLILFAIVYGIGSIIEKQNNILEKLEKK